MTVIRQSFTVSYEFPVIFTRDVFGPENRVLADLLRERWSMRNRGIVVVDSEVARLTPRLLEKISRFGEVHGELLEFVAPPLLVRGGEICKSDPREVEQLHALVERHGLCRHSFVMAIGGGAVLDATGYAAATAHRGVRLIRFPTSTLAQNDAGIGVKNGVNAYGRKNFFGTFSPPVAVINDFDFLATLPERDLRAGITEAVKVALIKDRLFFDWLHASRKELAAFRPEPMERMIIRCAELHSEHIGSSGDPFEFGSSRPLDYGHWSGHKLEELTGGEVRHGEAVAIGIALDSLYSARSGLIGDLDLHRILTTLEEIGFNLYHPALAWMDVARALREFQEHLGGRLSIPLLEGIGARFDAHVIDVDLYRQCIASLAERHERRMTTDRSQDNPRGIRDRYPLLS
jgi:3-dehydroquinate synthase